MGALHGQSVPFVKGAFMLIDQDTAIMKGLVAAAVKFLSKQPFPRPEGVGGIHNDEIVSVLAAADELQAVLVKDANPGIVQAAGGFGQKFPADLHHLAVNLHHINGFHVRITGQLPNDAAVPRSDDQDPAYSRMNGHGNVGDHLVIDELVLFGEHHVAVQGQKPAKFRRLKYVDALEAALAAVKLPVHPDGQLDIGGVGFRKPKFHLTFLSEH